MLTKIIVLILMAIFYVSYFIKMLSQKRRGISTDQLGKGKEGFIKFIEIALKISTYLLPAIQVVCIVFYGEGLHIAMQIAGVVLTALGVAVFITSVLQMKDNWRAGVQKEDKTELVTNGIYSISRNPAFLGFDLMYIGVLLSFFSWYLCIATVLVMILFHLQIVKVEEKFLEQTFGEEYLEYKNKVFRYIARNF